MKCPKCGAELDNDLTAYCSKCGTKITSKSVSRSKKSTINKKVVAVIVVIVIVIICIGLFASSSLTQDSKTTIKGLTFNVPSEFEKINNTNVNLSFEEISYYLYKPSNNTEDIMLIGVMDVSGNSVYDVVYDYEMKGMDKKIIDGKEGLISNEYNPITVFYYLEDNKLVAIGVPNYLEDIDKNYSQLIEEVII